MHSKTFVQSMIRKALMELKFMTNTALDATLATCPNCGEENDIWIHSQKERRYRCCTCERTFSETKGTIFYGLHYPIWMIVQVVTLLAHGCPVQAIVVAFMIDERTVASWQEKAGRFAKKVQEATVCTGQVTLNQVQADEMCITAQGGKVWVATAMDVFSRLFLWGEVGRRRNKKLIERLMSGVKMTAASVTTPILFAVDGFAAYPNAILKVFHIKVRNGLPGRPRHSPWPNLHIVQVVKHRSGRKLKDITRRLVHGCLDQAYEQIFLSQCGLGLVNTAYIERLNATFRGRMPVFVRRTRNLARKVSRIETELFWSGVVYNFCTIHTSLDATPAMAAGLTDHNWSIEELLRFTLPQNLLHDVL
jgi:transposase-like protein